MHKQNNFLKGVEKFNEIYSAISLGGNLQSLTLPFWSWREIQTSLPMRDEWNVPTTLIPFYGDWHDLICLEDNTDRVIAINDKREVIHAWPSIAEFLSSLRDGELSLKEQPKVLSAWLSPDLLEKANAFKAKK